MNVSCPNCGATYRVDPAKVPPAGVRARCTRCSEVMRVTAPAAASSAVGETRGDSQASPDPGTSGIAEGAAAAARAAVERPAESRGAEPGGESAPGGSPAPAAPLAGTSAASGPTTGAARAPSTPTTPSAPAVRPARGAPVFGGTDPDAKARRLARALISDIVVYHPERRDRSAEAGTLRQEFREEIQKSWEEYVAQVGDATARGTSHFRDALNEILAGGKRVF